MKIGLLLNHFLPYQVAGTEIYTWALAKSLQNQHHDVFILIPNFNTNDGNEYMYDGLRVVAYGEPNQGDRKLVTGKRRPDGIEVFEMFLRKENPDLVNVQEVSQSSGISVYHLALIHKLKIPLIVTFHLAGYSCFCGTLMYKDQEPCDGLIRINKCTACALSRSSVNSLTQRFLYLTSLPLYKLNIDTSHLDNKVGTAFSFPFIINNIKKRLHEIEDNADKIIVLADWFKKVLLLNGIKENKLSLVKQGLPYGNPLPGKMAEKNGLKLRIMFMGRLEPVKGLHVLIDALEGLDENKISLDIYGKGNSAYAKILREKCISKKNVQWKGIIPQPLVLDTIQQYDAIVIPSMICEMAPLLIEEAFAAGVIVIGSDVKGIAEQIGQRVNGLLFKMGNARELKQILENAITDKSMLEKLAANILPPRKFEQVGKETLEIYESVIKGKRAATYSV
jgi:glycosyltransferase involved in cell wall biosynthesis